MNMQKFDDSKIVNIQGPNGEFGIAAAGTTKEGFCYLYSDGKHRFFFYASISRKPVWTVAVESTSGIQVSREDEAVLKENISHFFRTRDFTRPEKSGFASAENVVISFSWGIAQ